MKISGCIIARNEEANIAGCIGSLKQVADEVIIVDTGSEDNTVKIARELGASVYEHEWENDFSKAKNIALEYAKGDWIIFLDADEFFDEDSLPGIRPIIEKANLNQAAEGILCNLVNIDPDAGKLIDSIPVMRIFRNRKQFRFVNKIHEQISNEGKVLKHVDHSESISIIHTGYSAALQIPKARRNLELLLEDTDNEIISYHLAITYFLLQDFENAYKYADLALSEKAVREVDHLACKMHFYKIFISLMDFDNEKIELLIKEANKKYGNDPEIARLEGAYHLREKRYEKAYDKYMHALDCQNKYGRTLGQCGFEAMIHEVYFGVAHLLYLMNREADAFGFYIKALQNSRYHRDIFDSIFKLCREMPESETIAFLNSLYDIGHERDLEFLISRIANCGISRIVLYYADKWNNLFFHEDDVLIYAFLAQGDYKKALEVGMIYLRKDRELFSPLVASILILGRIHSEADIIRKDISSGYYDLVHCFLTGNQYSGNTEVYLSVLSILVKQSKPQIINEYLYISKDYDAELIKGIAETFLKEHQFIQSIHYYQLLFELETCADEKAEAAFQIGYCFYKLKRYEEGVDWFEIAIEKGYKKNDVAEFLRWVID